jgi:hypothetical protein
MSGMQALLNDVRLNAGILVMMALVWLGLRRYFNSFAN